MAQSWPKPETQNACNDAFAGELVAGRTSRTRSLVGHQAVKSSSVREKRFAGPASGEIDGATYDTLRGKLSEAHRAGVTNMIVGGAVRHATQLQA